MNYVLPLLVVGSLAGGAGYINTSPDAPVNSAVFHAPASAGGELTFAAHSPGVDAVCLIKRMEGKTPAVATLRLDDDCLEVFADFGRAVAWLDREDGSAAIVDNAGRELLLLGPSDGFAYETSTPGAPIITLTALGNV